MKHAGEGHKRGESRGTLGGAGRLAAVLALAPALAGCVSQATYEEAVQDARQAREGAARYEASQRDVKISDLQAQMLTATIQFQSELRRQAEAQQALAQELIRLRQTADRKTRHPQGGDESGESEQALRDRIRDLEKQQQSMAERSDALEAELQRVRTSQKNTAPAQKKAIRAVELDLVDPWR
jgi:predicted RNase H-like nuclease (RuvC/YqgF family)